MEASAQVDPNLQSRLTTFAPPITVLRPEISSETLHYTPPPGRAANCQYVSGPGTVSDRKLAGRFAELSNKVWKERKLLYGNLPKRATAEDFIKQPEGVVDREKIAQLQAQPEVRAYLERHPDAKRLFTAAQQFPIVFACGKAQPTSVKISFPFNPTYETNVMKSDANIHSDSSLGFGGAVLVTGPGFRPYDVVGFSATSASARYSAFPSKSFDSLSEQGIYQFYLDARHSDGTGIDVKKQEVANLLTIDTVSVGFQNQTAFLPGFRSETVDLLTPQATLARQNIQLGNSICYTPPPPPDPTKPLPPKIAQAGFCYYVDLAVTAGQTFSDVLSQQNASIAGSATLGWRVPDSNWKLALPLVVTAKEYENVLGGRRDELFQIGPTASYVLPAAFSGAPSVSFSLAVTYNRNYSTLATASWHGFIVQPTLAVAFQPPPPVK